MSVLAEGESLSAYNRKRLSMSFERPDKPAKRLKSHSPGEENITWDVRAAVKSLDFFSEDATINWTAMTRRYGATQRNAGQVLKEAAGKVGIDVSKLEHKENSLPRVRSHKKKLPGGEYQHQAYQRPVKLSTRKHD